MTLAERLRESIETAPFVLGTLVLIAILALVAIRLSQLAVDAVVGTLLDREVKEGTAQELSAIEREKRRDTLRSLGSRTIRLFILVIAFVTALGALGLNVGPAIAGLGVAGLAFSLGAQHLVRDYLAGAFILVENQYGKGDIVKIADVTGSVEDFTLRRTTLRDIDGTVHSVPNGLIGVSSNLTRVWARVNLDLTLPYETDLEAATRIVDEIGRALSTEQVWEKRILEAPHVERIESLAGGVTLKVLGSVRAADRWAAASELRRRIVAAYTEAGIRLGG
jgi:moderate conductance mechanosensitive channel